jgi:hypothetical protein
MDRFLRIGFGVLAALAIIFGGLRIAQQLKLSFAEEGGKERSEQEDILQETKQKVMDTDKDSLTDWDELHVYSTSPYLADSDSDGIDDAAEIKNGTDPNCPKGKECGSKLTITPTATSTGSVAPVGGEQQSAGEPSAALPENLSASEVRELLKQGGVPEEELKDASDEDLLKLYEEARKQ